MRYINPKSKRGLVNKFAEFILSELNKNTTSSNLIKKVLGKYSKFKKIPNILRSDQNTSSLKNLKIFNWLIYY